MGDDALIASAVAPTLDNATMQRTFRTFDLHDHEAAQPFDHALASLGVAPGPAWPDRFGDALQLEVARAQKQPIRTLSLFSGGGGLDIGFHDAGFDIRTAVEIEPCFARTLARNSGPGRRFENSEVRNIDIREFDASGLGRIDFIIGGPPCQTFSAAGRRAAGVQGTDDPRGMLFAEYVRLLDELKPTGFLFENVYGIVGAQGGRPWRQIQDAFLEVGYRLFWRILDAADYGVPQHRERLFIVGLRTGEYRFPFPTHGPDSLAGAPYYTAGDAVADADVSGVQVALNGHHGHLLEQVPTGLNYSFFTQKMGHPKPIFAWRSKFSDYLYKADPLRPIRTLKAQGGQYTGPFSWESRPFAISELKRLQTFPDAYTITGSRLNKIKQLGNSVPPQIARILAISILEQVFAVQCAVRLAYMPRSHELGFRKRKRELTKLYRSAAHEAIARQFPDKSAAPRAAIRRDGRQEYTLTPDFALVAGKAPRGVRGTVKYQSSAKTWTFELVARRRRPVAEINVEFTAEHAHILGTRALRLISRRDEPAGVALLWRAAERFLKDNIGKDDLVQLFGYYQYPCEDRFKVSVDETLTTRNPIWRALAAVSDGLCVQEIVDEREVANAWRMNPSTLREALHELRRLGFEIRNSNTNPQIPKNHILVPYRFPTLTPQSVQLRRSLDGSHDR